MLNLSPEKLMVLAVFALVVLGPNRLPQAARTLAKLLTEVRKVSGSFQNEGRGALAEPHDVLNKAVGDLGIPSVPSIRSTVRDTMSGVTAPFSATAPTTPTPSPAGTAASATPAERPASPDDPSLN